MEALRVSPNPTGLVSWKKKKKTRDEGEGKGHMLMQAERRAVQCGPKVSRLVKWGSPP